MRTAILLLAASLLRCSGDPGRRCVSFTDATDAAGLEFTHQSGSAGNYLLPEIMGGGLGWLDFDGDGWLDLYLVQSGRLGQPDPTLGNRLLRNAGDGTFSDVTRGSGTDDSGYGMGCVAGDYDNDGDVDVYVTNLGANVLYRNDGDGRFSDVTDAAAVGDPGWSTSGAFCDYDADGDLDLFVANYVVWSEASRHRRCFALTGAPDYCSPLSYAAPSTDTLYRNDGGGRFTDVTADVGIDASAGNGLGVLCTDLNGDHRPDIYVANDQMASFAWVQQEGGRFVEQAVDLGIAVDEAGRAQAGMGVSAGDVDNDGDLDLWKVHMNREAHVLYENRGSYYDDGTTRWKLAAPTRPWTGFGTALVDLDLDGRLDVFVANGRVQYVAGAEATADLYAEPNQLLTQTTPGEFTDVSAAAGPALAVEETSRGAAFGDYDNDGDVDVALMNRDGPARLLRNDSIRRGKSVTLRLLDRFGRDALGATLEVHVRGESRAFLSGAAYSYLATNDPRVHVGLADAAQIDRVDVRWPDGATGRYGPFAADSFATIRQGTMPP